MPLPNFVTISPLEYFLESFSVPLVPGYLSNAILVSARPSTSSPAPWVEQCVCPTGYQGQFCEKCAPGYKRENSHNFGAFRQCVLCQCKGGGTCDTETGKQIHSLRFCHSEFFFGLFDFI